MDDQGTRYCPRCSTALTGPGFCHQCGLPVGYEQGQYRPLDAPAAVAPPDEPMTHVDLPPIGSSYRSPEQPTGSTSPPPAPPAGPLSGPYEPAPQPVPAPPPARGRSAFILPVLGIVCVLALIVGGLWFISRDNGDDTADDAPTEQGQDQSSAPDSTKPDGKGDATNGPLNVAAAYENQACTDHLIVVLASSGDPTSDDRTIGAAAKKVPDAKYLRTSKSCKTFNQSLNGHPIYAAYIGPFDSMTDACQARTDTGVAASYVRTLSTDRELREICSCQDEASALPRLSTTTAGEPSYDLELRVFDLQSLLYLAGANPSNIVTGTFGPQTEDMVRAFQRQQKLKRDGWVGPQTWSRLLSENCP